VDLDQADLFPFPRQVIDGLVDGIADRAHGNDHIFRVIRTVIVKGCAAVSAAMIPRTARTILIAFVCGFGGFAIMAQNMARLPGVRWQWYLTGKLLHGALCAGLCWAQLGLPLPAFPLPSSVWQTPLILACVLVILTAMGVFFTRSKWYNRLIPK
jgi:hypothetical protein